MPQDDNYFFLLVRQDDRPAFDVLFRKYYVQLCGFAYTFLHSRETAEEIVQEVFIRFWEQRRQININTSFLSYLYTSVKNQSVNELRKRNIRKQYENEYAKADMENEDVIQDENTTGKIKKAVESACKKLPSKCREIFELSRNDGLTYEEIAEYLNISKKTVENQMGIAFQKLRQQLEPFLHLLLTLFILFFIRGY
jgi:RNA polymerase sigma-70 factor (ECF subfamily)